MEETTENKKFFKTIQVNSGDDVINPLCEYVLVYRERLYIKGKKDMQDGVTVIAWHFTENGPIQQQEFIQVPANMIDDYIRDFSGITAQNFVDRFEI